MTVRGNAGRRCPRLTPHPTRGMGIRQMADAEGVLERELPGVLAGRLGRPARPGWAQKAKLEYARPLRVTWHADHRGPIGT